MLLSNRPSPSRRQIQGSTVREPALVDILLGYVKTEAYHLHSIVVIVCRMRGRGFHLLFSKF